MANQDDIKEAVSKVKGLKLRVPDGKIGQWGIETFTISPGEAALERAKQAGRLNRQIEFGHYKRLVKYEEQTIGSRTTIASNTPAEVADLLPFLTKAKGNVLIFGLGLGTMVQALIHLKKVKTITVIEKEIDVIALSGDYYSELSDKVTVVQGDVATYEASIKYDAVYIDIWPTISSEHLEQMSYLKQIWKKNAQVVICWGEDECKKAEQLDSHYI